MQKRTSFVNEFKDAVVEFVDADSKDEPHIMLATGPLQRFIEWAAFDQATDATQKQTRDRIVKATMTSVEA